MPGDQLGTEFIVGENALQFARDVVDGVWIKHGCFEADNLRNARRVGGYDRRPALHRLEGRQAKSFVEARKHKSAAYVVKPRQVIVIDISGENHLVLLKAELERRPFHRRDVTELHLADNQQLKSGAQFRWQARKRLHQAGDVLSAVSWRSDPANERFLQAVSLHDPAAFGVRQIDALEPRVRGAADVDDFVGLQLQKRDRLLTGELRNAQPEVGAAK